MAGSPVTIRQLPVTVVCILKPSKGKGTEKMRKIILLLCMSIWVLTAAPCAAASERLGSIRVKLEAGDLAVTNGAVTLYQVGYKIEEGYRIAESFGGGILRQEDADSETLAQWLAETAREAGMTMLLDADGNAVFSELEEGLYILVQTQRMDGFYPIYPVLLSVPEGEIWDVQIYREPVPVVTELPRTGQSPIPFLGILGMCVSALGLFLCARKERRR